MKEELKKAVEVMRRGGVILYPTDTVWGIGCDATNAEAVARIYEIKRRVESKSMIVVVDSMAKVEGYVREVPDIAWDLIEVADKPLTIIYDNAKNLPDNLVAEDGSIAIRITKERFSQELCRMMRVPVVSTSANVSGEPTARNFFEISDEILNAVDFVVDYRREEEILPAPSSIIKLGSKGQVKVIR